MNALSRGGTVTVVATAPVGDFDIDYPDARDDDAAQLYYLRCVRELSKIGKISRAVVSDRGTQLEFRARVRVPRGLDRQEFREQIEDSFPANVEVRTRSLLLAA